MLRDGTGEVVAGERRCGVRWNDILRSIAAVREEPEPGDVELGEALLEVRFGLGWPALCETCLDDV
jgi:hypothetical protein